MDGDRWRRLNEVFSEALQLAADQRGALVERLLPDDPELRAEVLELLERHEGPGPVDDLADALSGLPAESQAVLSMPDSIGPYRLLRQIGEGGMGVVYEAEQREPVIRRVAIKMMKVGMDTREVVGRFEAERQALAMMDHPGIAKVLGGGATTDGRPYFVMELVRGTRLDHFCDDRRLTTRERVALMIEVCAAIQHAHQKGVIHRDLKPSNVLVAEQDGRAQPRVIDFGIAKATGRQLTEKTVVTGMAALGTLTYMSPEQAGPRGADIDTRTDIYSLGVMLYEVLVGEVPVDPKELGPLPFLAQLVEGDSAPPEMSRRLGSLAPARRAKLAHFRRVEPSAFRRDLTADLQWIVAMAMNHDRDRRYSTVAALADDLDRFLGERTVNAHPPSTAYRTRKFVRRNRPLVVVATLTSLALATATMLTARSRTRAIQSEQEALVQAARAGAVNEFLVGLLGAAAPAQDGRAVRVAEVLDQASATASTAFESSPVTEASVRMAIGTTYHGLGLYDEGERELLQAADLFRAAGDPALADVGIELGSLLVARGDIAGARVVQQEAVDVRIEAFGPRALSVGEAMGALGESDFFEGRMEEAAANFRAALDIYADSLPPESELIIYGSANLSTALGELGDLEGSLEMNARALEGMKLLNGPDHVDVATVSGNHALKLQQADRIDEAEPFLLDALRIFRLAYGEESDRTARALNNLGAYYRRVGRLDEAAASLQSALSINISVHGEEHREVASNLRNLGLVYFDQEAYEQALELFNRALAVNRRVRPEHSTVAVTMSSVAWTMAHMGRAEESESLLREAIALSRTSLGDEHYDTAMMRVRLADVLRTLDRLDEAETLLEAAIRALEAALPAGHRLIEEAREVRGRIQEERRSGA